MAVLQKQNCCLQLLVVLAGYYSCVTLLPIQFKESRLM